jgi:hypothetical protein
MHNVNISSYSLMHITSSPSNLSAIYLSKNSYIFFQLHYWTSASEWVNERMNGWFDEEEAKEIEIELSGIGTSGKVIIKWNFVIFSLQIFVCELFYVTQCVMRNTPLLFTVTLLYKWFFVVVNTSGSMIDCNDFFKKIKFWSSSN